MDFLQILAALSKTNAQFIIVGGVAARLYGSNRLTHDIGIVPRLDENTWPKMIELIWKMGGRPRIPESLESIQHLGKVRSWMNEKGMLALSFRTPDGTNGVQSHDRCVWLRIDGSGIGDNDLLVMINMYHEPIRYHVPEESNTQKWVRLVDTASWAEGSCNCWQADEAEQIQHEYNVNPWSVVVLEELHK